MGTVEVIALSLPKDAGRFLKCWWPIYEDDPHWVPPLLVERKEFLNPKKNPYFQTAEVQCFLAVKDGVDVGTIAATLDFELQRTDKGMGLFGFFEFINDEDVAQALYSAACGWLKERGMTALRGPFNFNSNHEFGLLVDGFDTDPMISNPHNRAYYGDIYETLGLSKVMDWYAYWLDAGDGVPERIQKVTTWLMNRHPEITLRPMDKKNFDYWVNIFWEIYNDAWDDNWGHIYFHEAEFRFAAKNFKAVLEPELCWFAFVGDEPVAASISLPNYNAVAKKMNGKIFPFGWWHFLNAKKTVKHMRAFVLGVKRAHQKLPIGAPLYCKTWEGVMKLGLEGGEASLILEDNHRMRGALEKLGGRIYKTYRTYEMSLDVEVLSED